MSETTPLAAGGDTSKAVAIGPYTCHICFKVYTNGHQLGGHRKAHRPRQSGAVWGGGPIKRRSKKTPAARPQPVPSPRFQSPAPVVEGKKPLATRQQAAAPVLPVGLKEEDHRSVALVAVPVTGHDDQRCGPSTVMAEEEEVTSKVCLELALWWP